MGAMVKCCKSARTEQTLEEEAEEIIETMGPIRRDT